jgi:hypothetical protein
VAVFVVAENKKWVGLMEQTHWHFTFLLHTCNLGGGRKAITNPFTGEVFDVPIDIGLMPSEIEAVQRTFIENGIEGPEYTGNEGYGAYIGKGFEFRCFELDGPNRIESIGVDLRVSNLSDEVLGVILAVARAGNLALTSSSGTLARIVDRTPEENLLSRWPDAKTISSIEDVRNWLVSGIRGVETIE